jgi:hypothetical protein
MKESEAQDQLRKKIEDIRTRLLGDLTTEELQVMQLQADLLERSLVKPAYESHDHDGAEHHDHVHPDKT